MTTNDMSWGCPWLIMTLVPKVMKSKARRGESVLVDHRLRSSLTWGHQQRHMAFPDQSPNVRLAFAPLATGDDLCKHIPFVIHP